MKQLLQTGILLAFCSAGLWAGERHPARIDRRYDGANRDAFVAQAERVRLLVRQAQLEVSARLGLIQYREGFQSPLTIRFLDEVPAGLEHALAYVRWGTTAGGTFAQELVINVGKTGGVDEAIDQVFVHEMTHAVFNDAAQGDAAALVPRWVQEGLAQWVSDEGESRVRRAAQTVQRSRAELLLQDLDAMPGPFAYPAYYLAIDYLRERHSVNAIEALVRQLLAGASVEKAVDEATGLPLTTFQANVREYSLNRYRELARPDY